MEMKGIGTQNDKIDKNNDFSSYIELEDLMS